MNLILALLLWLSFHHAPATDACAAFDSWVGGERVAEDYPLPADAVESDFIRFPKAGIRRWYSIQQDTAIVKVYVNWQSVCVYRLRGSGMGLPEFDLQEQAV